MPQSLSQTIIHLIFSTKDREPFLDEAIKESMHAYLATIIPLLVWPLVAL